MPFTDITQGQVDRPQRYPEFACGNTFIRPNYLNKGTQVGDHAHNFDHTTLILHGSVHIKAKHPDGTVVEKDFVAPSWVLIKADTRHEITGLEDNTIFWCVYAHRNAQGQIVEQKTGWEDAYGVRD